MPSACKEIDHTRDGVAVGGEAVAQNKAVEAKAHGDAEQPAESDTKHDTVQHRQHHGELCVTDALDEGAATAHDGKSGEHPKDRCDEGAGHFMHSGVVGEEHEELLAESDIQPHEKQSQDNRKAPRPINGLLGTVFLSRRNVLADHGHGGILNALRDLVDDVVDAYTHAKRRRGNHPHLVDEGIDE